MRRALLMAGLGSVWTTAAMADDELYMFGGGVYLGTIVVPGEYPASFPNETDDAGGMGTGVKNDIEFGAYGKAYLDKQNRLGGRLGFGTGIGEYGYGALQFTLEYDRVEKLADSIEAILGAGIGVGTQSFSATNGNELKGATYLARGNALISFRDKVRAYEAGLTVYLVQPGIQKFTTPGADEVRIENDLFGGGFYWYVGFEAGIMFGDFTAPKKNKKSKSSSDSDDDKNETKSR